MASAKFVGREALMAKLRKLAPEAELAAAEAQAKGAQELADAVRARAPVRTGHYKASIDAGLLAGRGAGQHPVGIGQTKDPNAQGLFADFKWRWLEFGTRKMRARPHIFPTYRAMRKRIRRRIATAVNKAIKKAAG